MSNPKDGGPAFPHTWRDDHGEGMSLRDWFAGQALAGINANTAADAAALCYAIADAMLAARSKEA